MHVSLISDDSIKELTQGTEYTITDRVVTLSAPTILKIKIYRQTTTTPLVGWADASVLRAADMNVQSTQLLHLAEETSDLAQDGGLSKDTTDNVWDARYNKIKNLLDPTDPGDAVTLRYIETEEGNLIGKLNTTGAEQVASVKATGDTQNTRLTTTGNTQNTRLTTTGDTQNKRLTDTGDSYVATMTTLKDTTTTKATEASNSTELAKKWAVSSVSPDGIADSKSSKTWAEAAKVSASNAASSASASQTSATASQNSASSSASSASAATQKATEAASSASAAATSASTATTKATEAAQSATQAATNASAAAKSAVEAAKFDPSNYPLKQYTLDLSALDENTFYPVIFNENYKCIEAEIQSRSVDSPLPWNQNEVSFRAVASGWNDGAHRLTIKSYYVFDINEITIGCIALAGKSGGCCVWLRGGGPSPYTIISTVEPNLFATGYISTSGVVATIGPTYHGAETGNTYMNIYFSPLDIPSGSAKNFYYTTYGTFETAIKDSGGNVIKDTYAKKAETYNKTEVDTKITQYKPDLSGYYTKSEVDTKVATAIDAIDKSVIPGGKIWIE